MGQRAMQLRASINSHTRREASPLGRLSSLSARDKPMSRAKTKAEWYSTFGRVNPGTCRHEAACESFHMQALCILDSCTLMITMGSVRLSGLIDRIVERMGQ